MAENFEMPVEAIRQSHRYEMTINRKKLKHEENDLRRPLPDLRLAGVDLSALANKLKNKSEVTVSDLQTLKNLLIQDEQNIRLVLNTQGALRGLVREITGIDVNRQVEAAECLCNLALADLRGCLTIIKAAGAYLIAALDSQNLQLAVTCAWTVGNLCGAGARASSALAGAGAAAALCLQLQRDPELAAAAASALTLYAHAAGDLLSKDHLDLIVRSVGASSCNNAFRLFFILSCHADFSDPQGYIQGQLLNHFPDMMRRHLNSCVSVTSCCDLEYGIRTLANMECGSTYYNFLVHIQRSDEHCRDFLDLVKDPRLKTSMLWLLGNMCWRQDQHHFMKELVFTPSLPSLPSPPLGEEDDNIAMGIDRFDDLEPEVPLLIDEE